MNRNAVLRKSQQGGYLTAEALAAVHASDCGPYPLNTPVCGGAVAVRRSRLLSRQPGELGLFAARPIPQGAYILEYRGRIIGEDAAEALSGSGASEYLFAVAAGWQAGGRRARPRPAARARARARARAHALPAPHAAAGRGAASLSSPPPLTRQSVPPRPLTLVPPLPPGSITTSTPRTKKLPPQRAT